MSEKNVIAGRYELIEKIGDGGMAVVYKAKCRLLKRFVAIKILKPEFTKDIRFVENFRRESHAAASLTHPNIVGIYDVGQEGNINYIVMELVDGKTLSEVIDESAPFDYEYTIKIGKQIAEGLLVAHKNGIVHRDVKPHNILITKDGNAKITDFGIARAVSDTTIVDSGKESIMGSVHYFSPEQAKGDCVDEKSDIYSFGIILYEMLTGKVPFDAENPVTIALMQINEEMSPPSIYNQYIPPVLENIVIKATEKKPKNRFASFEQVIDSFREVDRLNNVLGSDMVMAKESEIDYIGSRKEFSKDGKRDTKVGLVKRTNKNNKGKNKIIIGSAVATLVVLISILSIFFLGGEKVKVPNFTGMSIEEAEKKAKELDIKIEASEYKESDEFRRDIIMEQDIEEGKEISKGKVVKLVISKGNIKGIIPDVIGKNEEEAKKMIEDYGFTLGKVKEKESEKPKGTVIEQSPKGGSNANGITDIDIVVSDGTGTEKAQVPNLLGMSKESARKALENEGFKLGKVSEGISDEYDKDEIIWQSYNAGTKLEKGESIDIKINKGVIGSTDIYLPLDEAKSENFTLDIIVSDEASDNRYVVKSKKYTKDGKEQVTIEGTGKGKVTVKFDGVEVMRKEVKFS